MHVLVNQVGYERQEPKQAIVPGIAYDRPGKFALVDSDTGKAVITASVRADRIGGAVFYGNNWPLFQLL